MSHEPQVSLKASPNTTWLNTLRQYPQHHTAQTIGIAAFAIIFVAGAALVAFGKTDGMVIAGSVTMGSSVLALYVTQVYITQLKMLAKGQHLTLRDWAFCLLLNSSRKKTS